MGKQNIIKSDQDNYVKPIIRTGFPAFIQAAYEIIAPSTLELALSEIPSQLSIALGMAGCSLFRWDEKSSELRFWSSNGDYRLSHRASDQNAPIIDLYPIYRSAIETCSNLIFLASDSNLDAEIITCMQSNNMATLVLAPLLAGNRCLGLIELFDPANIPFSNEDLLLCRVLAQITALSLNQHLQEILHHEERLALRDQTQSKSDFLATMSHEMRTPLNAMFGAAELLRAMPLDTVQKDLVTTIQISNDRLIKIIDQILSYAQIEQNGVRIEAHPFDLYQCIEQSLDMVAIQAAKKGLNLSYNVAEDTPYKILGDPEILGRVLINLLSNGIRFTENGDITIQVTSRMISCPQEDESVDTPQTYELKFSISDTGIGINPERIEKLLTTAQPSNKPPSSRYGGSGLGLAICSYLVNRMNGKLWAESSGVAGEGATFYFTIQTVGEASPLPEFLSSNQPILAGKGALIVCNKDHNRTVLLRLLKKWGMRASVYTSTQEVEEWLSSQDPLDVILLGADIDPIDREGIWERILAVHDEKQPSLILLARMDMAYHEAWGEKTASTLWIPIKPSHLYKALIDLFDTHAPHAATSEKEPGIERLSQAYPLKILMVEDEPTSTNTLYYFLTRMGFHPSIKNNGLQAFETLENDHYDVMIVDLYMPEMDGQTLTQKIRQSLPDDHQPFIIMLSGETQPAIQEQLLKMGVDVFLTKPVRGKSLMEVLQRASEAKSLHMNQTDVQDDQVDAQADEVVFDETVLNDFIKIMGVSAQDALQNLLDNFFDSAPKLISNLQVALSNQDWDMLKYGAHTLKGTSELFGLKRFSRMCKDLEKSTTAGQTDNMPALVEGIQQEFKLVTAFLHDKLAQLENTG